MPFLHIALPPPLEFRDTAMAITGPPAEWLDDVVQQLTAKLRGSAAAAELRGSASAGTADLRGSATTAELWRSAGVARPPESAAEQWGPSAAGSGRKAWLPRPPADPPPGPYPVILGIVQVDIS
ncbi:hypothetical protein UPYG_G00107420 [Umbra pygmaea]|uniref:Uncharacterized protein n=1 Tax=Umbra pygmaea TaxID=75934 RepID=A0ABD0X262_UMBPY